MNKKTNGKIVVATQYVPIAVCVVLVLLYLLFGKNLSAEQLKEYVPKEPFSAFLFVMLLYAVKSMSIFFPIIVLNILGGFIFEPIIALLVNSAGVLVELTIPYMIGKYSKINTLSKYTKKYPQIMYISDKQKNVFFLSFFLRIIAILPGDAISMYFGSKRLCFNSYLSGSFLGTLPGMIAATLLGTSITDPSSPVFRICAIITVGISAASLLVFFIINKKLNKQK